MPLNYAALMEYGANSQMTGEELDKFTSIVQASNIFYWNWELDVLKWFYDIHNAFLDAVMPIITKLGDAGIFWIILTLVLLIIPKTRKIGFVSLVALVLDVTFCNIIIKPIVIRCRPGWLMFYGDAPDWIANMKMLVSFPTDYSFPSGHTAASFASATAIFAVLENKYKWWGVGALILAAVIGISRLYVCVHWPTDVICGAILGVICGIIGWALGRPIYEFLNKKYIEFKEKRKSEKSE